MKIRKLKKDEFPKALNQIPQPPEQLFIKGELPPQEAIFLTVVGSRRFTSYGQDVCNKVLGGLKGQPIVIVSGLAIGMDTLAHKKALEIGLKTIAFPGSGLDNKVLHPSSNNKLADDIVRYGGCLISEFDPEMPAGPWTFPKRNRLMAGLSKAVLVIEAGERSGTLITARLATEYNRDVLVVPGSIFSSNSKGTNWLLKQGATPITSSEDLLEALGFNIQQSLEFIKEEEIKKCSAQEKEILELLNNPVSRDELVRILKIPVSEVNSILSIMEIKGLIKESLGLLRRII
ncbi:DNA protecting protein DprA [Candidatus Nomurabacteria bacterium RIFCSPLOWO2_01_FULL_33_24]|uniref:DNA protecting protein DprA n=1 Tax=Candidatus Nomurabacteria bacterium RIFCSPLOWO2_01_FULL_33_24 TaxID=1801765 RepID=A0A1F6X0R6_9BACT|nr:MAG: DNA protecting protein DprA [Candidatus Nomurabacteria bacterium RIFCSPLOWO2_01_FULL_33_24]